MQATPKFGYYEKVRVRSSDTGKSHLNGEIGAVLGLTTTSDQRSFLYAVSLDSSGRTWALFEDELESTGQWAEREDYFDGSTVRVRVDERGRGSLAPSESQE